MRRLVMAPGAPILVRGPNWVGDAVMALPFYDALRQVFPGSPITVAARPHAADIARLDRGVEVLEHDDRGRHAGLAGRLALAREIGRRRFCAAFLLPNSFSSALIPFLARIPERIGYSKDARSLLLTHPVPWDRPARTMHRTRAYLNLLERLGFTPRRPPRAAYSVSDSDRTGAEELLASRGIAPGQRLIGIAPGAVGASRRWPAGRFAGAASRLARELDALALVLGGPGDHPLCAAVAEGAGRLAVNLAGLSPLGLLPALIDRCLLLVSNDSGAAHVASLTRTPTLVLFGAGNEAITCPAGAHVQVIRRTLECTPCERNTCWRGDLACLMAIEVADVVAAATGMLAEQKPGAGC